jgi:hypothetical protein
MLQIKTRLIRVSETPTVESAAWHGIESCPETESLGTPAGDTDDLPMERMSFLISGFPTTEGAERTHPCTLVICECGEVEQGFRDGKGL